MTLTLDEVTLTYPDGAGRVTALDRVDLQVVPGEVVAVVGPSGSGKSSLLAAAATLIRPDTGCVVLDGVDTTGLRREALTRLRRERVGIVFQQANLLPALTVLDQLVVMAHVSGRPVAAGRGKALDLLESVGLVEVAGRRPHQLSGGQRQRVNIARALVNDPAVLLVDEPTSALDRERGAAVVELIASITRDHAVATVLVTHDTANLSLVDRVVECRDGRLGPAAALAELG